MIVRKPVYTHSLPISSQTGFLTRKSGFLTITWALYQTATPPLWASNGLLPSTLMYHEFTWRSCVGWYLHAGHRTSLALNWLYKTLLEWV